MIYLIGYILLLFFTLVSFVIHAILLPGIISKFVMISYSIILLIVIPFIVLPFLFLGILPLLGLRIPITPDNLLAGADTGFGLLIISLFFISLIFILKFIIFKIRKRSDYPRPIEIIWFHLGLIAWFSPFVWNCQISKWVTNQVHVCFCNNICNINPITSSIKFTLIWAKTISPIISFVQTFSFDKLLNSIAN